MNKVHPCKLNILLVEDDVDISNLLEVSFNSYVDNFYIAEDFNIAIELFKKYESEIDFVISEMNLLKEDDYKFLRLIKKSSYNQKVSVLVDAKESENLIHTMNIGVSCFFSKPLDIELMKASLHDIYEKKLLSQKNNLLPSYLSFYWEMTDEFNILSITDKSGKITYVNDYFCRVSGYSKDELIGQTHNIIRHPEYSDEFFKEMWETISSGTSWRSVVKNRKKTGKDFYSDTLIYPILGENEGYVSLRHDITSQIESEKKATLKNKRLQALFDATPDILILTDGVRIMNANSSFLNFFSEFKNLEEFLDKHQCVCEFFEEEDGCIYSEVNGENWLSYILNNPNKQHKAKIINEGITYTFLLKVSKVQVNSSESIVILSDISELEALRYNLERRVDIEINNRKEKEALLERSSRMAMMGEMISMIAHQWRQPLSNITTVTGGMNMELLMGMTPSSEQLRDKIDEIEDTVQHLSKTIEDFRNFFKPDKKMSHTDLVPLLQQSVSMLNGLIKSNGVNIVFQCDEAITLYTHKRELLQVCINIIKNSMDALSSKKEKKPTINLLCSKGEDRISLVFRDNAGGIPEDIIDKIFNPYFSTKGNIGTGLGLYMSKNIIESHCNGTLSVQNIHNGAEFTITLPIKKENKDV